MGADPNVVRYLNKSQYQTMKPLYCYMKMNTLPLLYIVFITVVYNYQYLH
jgi:hypothetical protein